VWLQSSLSGDQVTAGEQAAQLITKSDIKNQNNSFVESMVGG
jgi:hypothetical protein